MKLAAALLLGSLLQAPPERPHDPWVFRCVLDERPRSIVVALHEDLWLAYDAATCSLVRTWTGGVELEGAVYDAVHGPQPTTRGHIYSEGAAGEVWWIERGGERLPARAAYRGYRIEQGALVLLWRLDDGRGTPIEVEERPEHVESGPGPYAGILPEPGLPGLSRRFALGGVGEGERVLLFTRWRNPHWFVDLEHGFATGPFEDLEEWGEHVDAYLDLTRVAGEDTFFPRAPAPVPPGADEDGDDADDGG